MDSTPEALSLNDVSPENKRSGKLQKRDSLFDDELSNFDDDEFGDDESFRDVFDEDNPSSGNLGNENMRSTLPSLSASGSTDYSTKAPGLDESQSDLSFTDAIGPTNDGPPPPPPTTTTTKTVTSGKYQDEVAVGLSSLSPPPSVDGGGSSMGFSQTWHDTAVDGPHREKMLQDISQLLYERKKGSLSNEKILSQTQAQSRTFERHLYKIAASLEEYKDTTTLKKRIARLAYQFASHFKEAKGKKSSTSSCNLSITSVPRTNSADHFFSNAYLRQTSIQSAASNSSRVSMASAASTRVSMDQSNLQRQSSIADSASIDRSALPDNLSRVNTDFFPSGSNGLDAIINRVSAGSNGLGNMARQASASMVGQASAGMVRQASAGMVRQASAGMVRQASSGMVRQASTGGNAFNPVMRQTSDASGSIQRPSLGVRNSIGDLTMNGLPGSLELPQQPQMNNSPQLQQQLWQLGQQMGLPRQSSIGQVSNDLMASQGSILGGNLNMMLLNQMQQQNPMNLNMVLNLNLLQQQQHQQQQSMVGLNMLQHSQGMGVAAGNGLMNSNLGNLWQPNQIQGMIGNNLNSRETSIPSQLMPGSQGMMDDDGSSMLPRPFKW